MSVNKLLMCLILVLVVIGMTGALSSLAQAETVPVTSDKSQIDPKQIQEALTEAGYYSGTIDGVIGKKSRAAIREFQEKHGLTPDGVCGPKTWEKLKAYLEEAKEMDAVDETLTTPTVDENVAVLEEDPVADPWAAETETAPEESDELKQKLVS